MTLDTEVADRVVAALGASDFESYRRLLLTLPHEEDAPIWGHIASAHPGRLNLFDALLASADGTGRLGRMYPYVLPAILKLPQVSECELLKVLDYAKLMGDSYQYSVAHQIEPLFASDPSLGAKLGAKLAHTTFDSKNLVVWALAFAAAAPVEAANYVLSLLDELRRDVDGGGAARLHQLASLVGTLRAHRRDSTDNLLTKEAELVELLLSTERRLGQQTWTSLASMSWYSKMAANSLLAEVAAGNPRAIFVVSVNLRGHTGLTFGASEVPTADVVHLLVDKALTTEAVRHEVDEVLSGFLHRSSLRSIAIAEIERFGSTDINLYESFKSTAQTLQHDAKLLTHIVTTWLFTDRFRAEPIRSLLAPLGGIGPTLTLDPDVFVSHSGERQAKALRRLLFAVHSGDVLLAYVRDLVETPAMQPAGITLGAEMLDMVWREYPESTRRFLDNRQSEVATDTNASRLYSHVLQASKAWDERLAALPRRKELTPTSAEFLAIRAVRQKRSRQISRLADKGSFFSSIFTKSHIAQGHSFVVETDDGKETIAPMNSMSFSMELPFSETADPVGGLLRRLELLKGAM